MSRWYWVRRVRGWVYMSAWFTRYTFAFSHLECQKPCGGVGSPVMLWCRCALASHVFIVFQWLYALSMCAKVSKVSSWGRAIFVGHCRTESHMERDSVYRLFRGIALIDNFDKVLPLVRRELRETALGELAALVMKSRSDISVEVEDAMELENAGVTVWQNLFGISREINSCCRRSCCVVSKISLHWRPCGTLSSTIFPKKLPFRDWRWAARLRWLVQTFLCLERKFCVTVVCGLYSVLCLCFVHLLMFFVFIMIIHLFMFVSAHCVVFPAASCHVYHVRVHREHMHARVCVVWLFTSTKECAHVVTQIFAVFKP